jgi:hypothetical protein
MQTKNYKISNNNKLVKHNPWLFRVIIIPEKNIFTCIHISNPFMDSTTNVGHGRNINEMIRIASSNAYVEVVDGNL